LNVRRFIQTILTETRTVVERVRTKIGRVTPVILDS